MNSYFEPYNGEELPSCPLCGCSLWQITRDGKRKFRVLCDCEREKSDKEETKALQVKESAKIERNRKNAFLYDVLDKKTFSNSDARYGAKQQDLCERYARKFIKTAGKIKTGLLLYGSVGGGKTFLSAAVANEVINAGHTVIMRSMPKIMAEYRLNSGSDLLQQLESCELLILDDLGAERDTSYGQELVYNIIDGRYSAEKPMIISTNLTLEQMHNTGNMMYDRTYDRILECCFPIKCDTGRKRVEKNTYEIMKKELFS